MKIKNKKFYIFCPLLVTGGPEALHQLCSELNNLGFDAYMYYYMDDNVCKKLEIEIISVYSNYNVKKCPDYIKNLSNLDHEDNIIIIPEIVNKNIFPNNFKSKLIYWFLACPDDKNNQIYKDPKLLKYYIACQSQEVYDRILNTGFLNKKKCFKLSDYTRQNFIHTDDYLKSFNRKNYITFCFKKKPSDIGFKHYEKIFSIMSDYQDNFIEIKNLSSEEVKNLGLISKIYIDFSLHPGKDRVPREMASTGCIVITGNQNVASNDVDVPLKDRKFAYDPVTDSYDYERIVEQIKYDLKNYETSFNEQFTYRELIRKEKQIFKSEILNIIKEML